MKLRNQKHHYQLEKTQTGFEIIPEEYHRPIIGAILFETGEWELYVRYEEESGESLYNTFDKAITYDFYGILNKMVEALYQTWEVPDEKKNLKTNENGEVYDPCEEPISHWAKEQTRRTLARKARDFWRETIETSLEPEVGEVLRKCYAVSRNSGNWGRVLEAVRRRKEEPYFRHLFQDLKNFYPARVSLLHDHDLWQRTKDQYGTSRADWRLSYQAGGQFYTSLHKTLSNMPQGITYHYLFGLKSIRLPEPATTRLKLFTYVYLGRFFEQDIVRFEKVILKSSEDNIRKAIEYVWNYMPTMETGDFRKPNGIAHALNVIFDYPHPVGDWDMLGLAKRSEEWHHQRNVERQLNSIDWDIDYEEMLTLETARPPIDLPKDKNIRFLATHGDVVIEGDVMHHCIASYATSALKGKCYLFHIEYGGEKASVEVKPQGYVGQAYGPKDVINRASIYGRKVLTKWAEGLVGAGEPILSDKISGLKQKPVNPIQVMERHLLGVDEIPF